MTPQQLYGLAKQCLKVNTLDLTEEQQNYVEQALSSFEAWQKLMSPSDQSHTMRQTAYLVRTTLMEQLVPDLFSSHSSKTGPHLFDTYHTLEFDHHAMLLLKAQLRKQQQEAAQAREAAKQQYQREDSLEKKLSLLKEVDTTDFKYLVKGIIDNREKTNLSDHDLCQLLLDVKSNKPKFPEEDEKDHQEELYEACKKVLNDLKNYTDHSFPFLTKVSKREAPDYLDVIKEPMDLGMVARKLKQADYKSKKEFARDLYLIYDNCLEYNTNPSSEYRKHAVAMRRKTDRLLARVPDIELKQQHRTIESASESESDDDDNESVCGEETSLSQDAELETLESSTAESPSQLDDRESCWVQTTHKTRARMTWETERQYQFPFAEREAIRALPLDIERHALMELMYCHPDQVRRLVRASRLGFIKWMERHEGIRPEEYPEALVSDLDSEDEQDVFFSKRLHDRLVLPDQERDDLFLPEYNMVPGLPTIDGLPVDLTSDSDDEALPSFDIVSSTQCPSNALLHQNIECLSDVRTIHHKCKSIIGDVPLDVPCLDEQTTCLTPSSEKISCQAELTQETAHNLLQHAMIHLLSHAGFEGAQARPMQILIELMAEQLSSVCKSLRHYWDDYHQTMTGEEVLLHVLYDHGVQLDDLDHYVTGVEQHGKQLSLLKEKLENTYQGLLDSPKDAENTEIELFEQMDQEDAFTIGLFGKDMIEDYFKFEEIGLSHLSSQIPPKLWFGHDTAKIKKFTPAPKESTLESKHHPPPKFAPVTHESQWIGLLQPWYQEQPDRTEDEYSHRKRRPKYPPIHYRSALESGRKRDPKEEETKKKRKKRKTKVKNSH